MVNSGAVADWCSKKKWLTGFWKSGSDAFSPRYGSSFFYFHFRRAFSRACFYFVVCLGWFVLPAFFQDKVLMGFFFNWLDIRQGHGGGQHKWVLFVDLLNLNTERYIGARRSGSIWIFLGVYPQWGSCSPGAGCHFPPPGAALALGLLTCSRRQQRSQNLKRLQERTKCTTRPVWNLIWTQWHFLNDWLHWLHWLH